MNSTDIARKFPLSRIRAALANENSKYPVHLVPIDRQKWPGGCPPGTVAAWRSRGYLVQVVKETSGFTRLSINRAAVDGKTGRWVDGITWDDIQRLKAEAGYASCWAVEAYPPDAEVVNVANIRHVFLLPEAPPFAWRRTQTQQQEGA